MRKKFPHFGIGLRGVFDDTVERFSLGLLGQSKRAAQATVPTSVPEGTWGAKKGGEGKT